jgi:Fic family protein
MAKLKLNTDSLAEYISRHAGLSSKELYDNIFKFKELSYATFKRLLQELLSLGFIITAGKGKSTKYYVSNSYAILHEVDQQLYFKEEQDQRSIQTHYNHQLIKNVLNKIDLFSLEELGRLNAAQENYTKKTSTLSDLQFKKDLERLAIDLSWKSSQIEGNTYSLLETERLLKDKETAAGKTKDEAVMLLNHKEAIDFISAHTNYVRPLKRSAIEDIHSILVKELNIDRNLRIRGVGISGTNYKPIDNEFQIREAMEELCGLINLRSNAFEKALLTLALISYIQPFNDGNKRTARIVSNAILMDHKYCPLSFRTVDSLDYKKAMLIFYETNNISAIKKIFIQQFEFATDTYF